MVLRQQLVISMGHPQGSTQANKNTESCTTQPPPLARTRLADAALPRSLPRARASRAVGARITRGAVPIGARRAGVAEVGAGGANHVTVAAGGAFGGARG